MSKERGGGLPSLSVVIPAYNEAGGIGPVLERVQRTLQQCGEPFEVLVVNDGSEDETADVAAAAGA